MCAHHGVVLFEQVQFDSGCKKEKEEEETATTMTVRKSPDTPTRTNNNNKRRLTTADHTTIDRSIDRSIDSYQSAAAVLIILRGANGLDGH